MAPRPSVRFAALRTRTYGDTALAFLAVTP